MSQSPKPTASSDPESTLRQASERHAPLRALDSQPTREAYRVGERFFVVSESALVDVATEAVGEWIGGWYGDPKFTESDYSSIAHAIVRRLAERSA